MHTKGIAFALCLVSGWSFATVAYATDYFIHVGGVCSVDFTTAGKKGKAPGYLGRFPGAVSIDAHVDQRNTMSQATADMKAVLDSYCRGSNWCYVYTYSNGAATISRTLSIYSTNWNIYYVLNAGGNEGGSELSRTDWMAEVFLQCALAADITPSDHRNGWNHNDTNGVTINQIGGYNGWWYTSWLLPGEDDGAVAYHSAGGMNDTYAESDLCQPGRHWVNHHIAWTCNGYNLDHYDIKMKGICELGGC